MPIQKLNLFLKAIQTVNLQRHSIKKLSEKRADSVFKFLTDNGIEASRLSTVGFGEMAPTVSNDTAEGRAQNRRVEIKLSN